MSASSCSLALVVLLLVLACGESAPRYTLQQVMYEIEDRCVVICDEYAEPLYARHVSVLDRNDGTIHDAISSECGSDLLKAFRFQSGPSGGDARE